MEFNPTISTTSAPYQPRGLCAEAKNKTNPASGTMVDGRLSIEKKEEENYYYKALRKLGISIEPPRSKHGLHEKLSKFRLSSPLNAEYFLPWCEVSIASEETLSTTKM